MRTNNRLPNAADTSPTLQDQVKTDTATSPRRLLRHHTLALSVAAGLAVSGYAVAAEPAPGAQPSAALAATGAYADATTLGAVRVEGEHVEQESTTTRLPLTPRETPQSISEVSREQMDLASMTDVNDVLMNVPGINVTLYDSQRPLYFARGFQITDFQVDGIPTYSGSTNQEYDTALYERVEVIRGANGLLSGTGTPSATVNLIRKKPGTQFDASVGITAGSWNLLRGVGDVTIPLSEDGRYRSRVVFAHQDGDSFRDRYQEHKAAVMGVIEGDLTDDTTLSIGYQNQDNNPTGTIWGTIPLFAADGSVAHMPRSTSFSPTWTRWQRESSTAFATLDHAFNDRWSLKAAYNRTEGDVFSLRVYSLGFPDRDTGAGTRLLASVGESEDVRDSFDVYLSGSFDAFGREHDVVVGANAYDIESNSPSYDSSIRDWSYDVPNAWNYDGSAPLPTYAKTGAYRIANTEQFGAYASTRFRATDALSVIAGARVTSWKTGTDNYDPAGAFTGTTGAYEVDNEITPYFGVVHDLGERFSLYASYTDIFRPQNYKDKDNHLLEPVLGSNLEGGIKAELLDQRLFATAAVFRAKQDNFAVRDSTQPDGSLPDGSSAYIAVDGTQSQGIEFSLSGHIRPGWLVSAGYTFVDTERHASDLIWTNLPEHYLQLSTHYQLSGRLSALTVGGGVNWQSETVGYNIPHPSGDTVTFTQDAYALANLHATWRFNPQVSTTLSVTNAFDKTYWANIDYANYGEPRNVSLTLKWNY
ncbi:MAG: TonB-dependent siderophore receptor [Lysobacter sp.]